MNRTAPRSRALRDRRAGQAVGATGAEAEVLHRRPADARARDGRTRRRSRSGTSSSASILPRTCSASPATAADARALNVNTIDEVPDSNWFTNRILARPMSIEEAVRGPQTGPGRRRADDADARQDERRSPGFTLRDSAGDDLVRAVRRAGLSRGGQRGVDGGEQDLPCAGLLADRELSRRGPARRHRASASARPSRTPSGKTRRRSTATISQTLLARSRAAAERRATAMLASRALPGRPVGGFRYNGTRRTIRTTSCRTSIAASCARCRCSARGPTSWT